MACRDAYKIETKNTNKTTAADPSAKPESDNTADISNLLFGVDSKVQSNDILQNNLTEFDWVTRNKLYPNFWGRNITGENCLTKEEIDFLHNKGCKIAAIYTTSESKESEEQGKIHAKKIAVTALELGIPESAAIFLEVEESVNVTTDYMRGYAQALLSEGYIPGFKANTDAICSFDREYSRGMQTDKELFSKCLIWAASPSLQEYERVTTTHLIHPDNWVPHTPSGTERNKIALWQYGKNCHPINDDAGKETAFNVNLVRNEQVIIDRMF